MNTKRILLLSGLVLAAFTVNAQMDTNSKGKLTLVTESGIERLHQSYIQQNRKDNSLEGYRVQFYNGRKAETLEKRSEFLSEFPSVPVYTLYESPEYKVQAGDFRTRLEAEKFLRKVIREFGSGFVVKTEIKPPRLEIEMDTKK